MVVMRRVPLSEAKARFADCVRAVEQGELILLTRHDKAVAALVRPENIERLERLQAAGPEGGLLSLAGGWEGSGEIVRIVAEHPRTTYRIVPDQDEGDR
jgi:prevent-host-death family protein